MAKYRAFLDEAADVVLKYGGSLSGEHGDGQARAALLPKMFGPELMEAFREFKALWDPTNRMNPGKLIDPVRVYEPTENLRIGPGYSPSTGTGWFTFPGDNGLVQRGDGALCRGGSLPEGGFGDHVPELHGDAGGEALHAGAGALALGIDAGGCVTGWMAE